jgi:thiol-disulfide isomerase/thioredoxin
VKVVASFVVAFAALTTAAFADKTFTQAPDVALVSEAGPTVKLSDFKGQVVLVDFWASWCIPCRTSFPAIDALHKELRDRGFTALAVNVDEQRRNADAFLSVRPHTMTVLFDSRGQAAQMFQLKGMPATILIDRAGQIRVTHTGYTAKTIAQYRAEVLALLGES